MPLVTSKEMFEKAYQGGYAIGAFNVNNMEIVQGITEAAKDLNAPLILQVSKGARAYANHTYRSIWFRLRWRRPDFPLFCIWTMATPMSSARAVLTAALLP